MSKQQSSCPDFENVISNTYVDDTNLNILEDGSYEPFEVDSHNYTATEPIQATAVSDSPGDNRVFSLLTEQQQNSVLSNVPKSVKENQYFLIDNSYNVPRRTNKQHSVFVDGPWDATDVVDLLRNPEASCSNIMSRMRTLFMTWRHAFPLLTLDLEWRRPGGNQTKHTSSGRNVAGTPHIVENWMSGFVHSWKWQLLRIV